MLPLRLLMKQGARGKGVLVPSPAALLSLMVLVSAYKPQRQHCLTVANKHPAAKPPPCSPPPARTPFAARLPPHKRSPSPTSISLAAASAPKITPTAPAAAAASRTWEWNWRTGTALACSAIISLVIAPGGSGGAQLYYPLFNVLLGFSIRDTAAIVSFVMFLGAAMSCSMAVAERHPTDPAARPLIDYGSVLIVSPAVLLGVAFGVIANAIVPLWLLQAASIAVFSWAFIKIMLPYLALRAKERQRDAAAGVVAEEIRQVVVAGGDGDDDDDGDAAASAAVAGKDGVGLPPVAAGRRGSGGGSLTLGKLEQRGDAARAAAAAAAVVAEVLGRGPSGALPLVTAGSGNTTRAAHKADQQQPQHQQAQQGPLSPRMGRAVSAQIAEDLAAFCAIDHQVRALNGAALDDFVFMSDAAGRAASFACSEDTKMMIAAVDAAAAQGREATLYQSPLAAAAVTIWVGSAAAASDAAAAKAELQAADPAAAPPPAAATAASKRFSLCVRIRTWAARQPGLLMVLTLAVLAQQVVFSILQRSVVKACSDAFYILLGVRVAVTVVIAVCVSIVVTRRARSSNLQPAASFPLPPSVNPHPKEAPAAAAATATAAAGCCKGKGGDQPALSRSERRAARRAAKEAAKRLNWEAIQWGPQSIVKMNGAMLLIGVLGGW